MKKRIYLLSILATAFLFTACSDQKEVVENQIYEVQKEASYSGKDYITVGKGSVMELKLQPETGNLRWENTKTGEFMDTTKIDSGLTDKTALSDIVTNYFNGTASKKYNTTTSMDTHSYGAPGEGLVYEEMENGVRFVYTLGENKVTYKNFPAYIQGDRMENLVLQYCDAKQKKAVLNQYRLMNSGAYARKTNENSPLNGLAATQLYTIFYEVGQYTYDELLIDCEEFDKMDELPSTQTINMVVEYYLEGDELVVRIPTANIVENPEYPMESLDVLPYFMSSADKEGYMFVPDGSGALIYLDNDKLTEFQFEGRYYGGDVLQKNDEYNSVNIQMTLPVYGMKTENYAVLGIIEEGAEIARLNSYISGYYSGINYSRSSLRFFIREGQLLQKTSNAMNNYTMVKASDDYYRDDIKIRYCFIEGKDASYVDMAKIYKEKLIESGELVKHDVEDEAPLFVKLLGEVDKEKFFLGIPYDGSINLTTFKEAEAILSDIKSAGIDNIKVMYSGIANGGLNQRAVEKVSISSSLGGNSGWKNLMEFAEKNGIDLYPGFSLQTASTGKNLSKEERAYTLKRELAILAKFDLVNHKVEKDDKYPVYVISPHYIADYIEKFSKSYAKIGNGNVGSDDFFTFMSPDYRNKGNMSIKNAAAEYEKALKTLAENNNLMLSNPIVRAYSDTDYITDVPDSNSGLKVLDASVPFVQIVLEGYIPYASQYVNSNAEALVLSVMKAMETKSALNFRFIATETVNLYDTTANKVFFAEYDQWSDKLKNCYSMYEDFWNKVKDAEIVSHTIVDRNNDLVVVEYSNHVKLYLNYSDDDAVIQGVNVSANSYVIKEGGR